jgi:hypothetical protein
VPTSFTQKDITGLHGLQVGQLPTCQIQTVEWVQSIVRNDTKYLWSAASKAKTVEAPTHVSYFGQQAARYESRPIEKVERARADFDSEDEGRDCKVAGLPSEGAQQRDTATALAGYSNSVVRSGILLATATCGGIRSGARTGSGKTSGGGQRENPAAKVHRGVDVQGVVG